MISRRIVLGAVAGGLVAIARGSHARPGDSPASIVQAFYDALLSVMRNGPTLGFAGRREKLAPAIRRAFDLPLMTRLMVGPQWNNLAPVQQEQLVSAFGNLSIATYANRFDDYSGERFEVDPTTIPANGGVIIHTKLIKSDGEPVQLDYLLRNEASGWQIVDVYLSGTVSELATRRSEFSSVLRRDGPDALVDLLQRKTAQLSS
jgi:phospholipid transport system substrate-binding protein